MKGQDSPREVQGRGHVGACVISKCHLRVPSYLSGLKTLSECVKLWLVSNPTYTVLFLHVLHTYNEAYLIN
jgi:hypothetical protein